MLTKSNILLLDEPTNHLDIETKNIIAEAINEYKNTILLVSHDIEFVEKLDITRMLILPKGNIEYYDLNKVKYYNKLNEKIIN